MIAIAIDAILGLVVLEGVALVVLRRRTGQGLPPGRLVANLAAGFSLMLAVRLSLAQAPESILALCLVAALVAHLADLAQGWQS